MGQRERRKNDNRVRGQRSEIGSRRLEGENDKSIEHGAWGREHSAIRDKRSEIRDRKLEIRKGEGK